MKALTETRNKEDCQDTKNSSKKNGGRYERLKVGASPSAFPVNNDEGKRGEASPWRLGGMDELAARKTIPNSIKKRGVAAALQAREREKLKKGRTGGKPRSELARKRNPMCNHRGT